jgi:hypothetical protein
MTHVVSAFAAVMDSPRRKQRATPFQSAQTKKATTKGAKIPMQQDQRSGKLLAERRVPQQQ